MLIQLSGTESLTLEIGASLPVGSARELISEGLELEQKQGRVPASLLLFRMSGLHGRGLPVPHFDYWEALWRVGIVWDGAPAWVGLKCDLDHAFIVWAGARFIRYPVRRAAFVCVEGQASCAVTVTVSGVSFQVGATFGDTVGAVAPRRLLVRHRGGLYEVPWEEEPAPYRAHAEIAVLENVLAQETFGRGASFERVGTVHRGRTHRCGLARRL